MAADQTLSMKVHALGAEYSSAPVGKALKMGLKMKTHDLYTAFLRPGGPTGPGGDPASVRPTSGQIFPRGH